MERFPEQTPITAISQALFFNGIECKARLILITQ